MLFFYLKINFITKNRDFRFWRDENFLQGLLKSKYTHFIRIKNDNFNC